MSQSLKPRRMIALCLVFTGLVILIASSLMFFQMPPLFAGTAYAQSSGNESEGVKNTASSAAKSAPEDESGGVGKDGSPSLLELNQTGIISDQLMEDLRAKEADLIRREQELEHKKLELETLRDDIASRLKEIKMVRTELQQYLQKADSKRKKHISQLVLMLNSTKDTQSALIFEGLETDLAVEIISQMESKKAAKVIDKLRPEVMIKIIEEMNRIRKPATASATSN